MTRRKNIGYKDTPHGTDTWVVRDFFDPTASMVGDEIVVEEGQPREDEVELTEPPTEESVIADLFDIMLIGEDADTSEWVVQIERDRHIRVTNRDQLVLFLFDRKSDAMERVEEARPKKRPRPRSSGVWRFSIEMTPSDADDRPGFIFEYDETMENIEFDHQPTEKEIAKAITRQGYKTSSENIWYSEADGLLSFKGETDDEKYFFNVDPFEDNPKLSQDDFDRFFPRLPNPMRKGFWRPEPPHGPPATEHFVDPLSTKGAVDTGMIVAVSGQGWAPCSIIIAKVFRSKRTGELFYSTKDERHSTLDSDNSNSPIYAREMGWDGPLDYTPDQVDEMFERMEQQGPCRGLTQDEFDDADSFFSDREGEAFDDPGYF